MKNGDAKPKSVLITGATEGLGKALALIFLGYVVSPLIRFPQRFLCSPLARA